jgi:flagellar biosynthesis component FlhA
MMQSAVRVPFVQPEMPVEKQHEFELLRSAMARIFATGSVQRFLQLLQRKGVPIRDFDRILAERLLETADKALAQAGHTAKQLYEALSVGDQAQIREFYFTTLEEVELPLREKYNKLYRYY